MKHDAMISAACLALAVIQGVMLASLYFQLAPHPPRAIPLFALAPFLAVSIASALAARELLDKGARGGGALAGLAAALALLSFGPQKYADPAFAEIWIAVIASQIAVLVIAVSLIRGARAQPA